jgi:hypothetical protein
MAQTDMAEHWATAAEAGASSVAAICRWTAARMGCWRGDAGQFLDNAASGHPSRHACGHGDGDTSAGERLGPGAGVQDVTNQAAREGIGVTGIEVAVGLLVAWLARKAKRVGQRADTEVDTVLDAGMDRLHDLVTSRLGSDTAMVKLHAEAQTGQVSDRARDRVTAALEDTTEADPQFARQLQDLVEQVQALAAQAGGDTVVAGAGGAVMTGDLHNTGSGTAIGAVGSIDTFTVGASPPDPREPDR